MIGNFIRGKEGYFYFVFRVFVGLLFVQHGGQKLFGWFGGLGGQSVDLFSLMGLAGFIEFFGGLAVAVGLFTRFAAFFSTILMVFAYFIAHVPQGLIPFVNKGELALLYFVAFLLIIAYGAGKWSLEKAIFKKEFF